MYFISGEKIQFCCDHFIGTQSDFSYNRNVLKYKEKFVELGTIQELFNNKFVFCYTHVLKNFNKLVETLNIMKNPFILVFHNSDGKFENKHIELFNKFSLLEKIYCQNMDVIHDKVIPLPIGFANSQWGHGNPKIYEKVFNMNIEKTKHIYFNFNVNTNRRIRKDCYNKLIKFLTWNESKRYNDYLIELKSHKYAICPEGNGIDTHRFWECIYMNTIPICLHNKVVDYYKNIFPIIILNDWTDLENINLEKEYENKIDNKNKILDYSKNLLK